MSLLRTFQANSGFFFRIIAHPRVIPGPPLNLNLNSNFKLVGIRRFSSEAEQPPESATTYYRTPASEPVFSDISKIDSLSPREFRIFINDVVAAKVDDVVLWSKAASYCIERASSFKFFDALLVLQSFVDAKIFDRTLFAEFARVLTLQSPQMEPRHLVQCVDIYASTGSFPEALFLEVFYGIIKQSEKMYASEFVDMFSVFSKWKIRNEQVLSALCKSLSKNISVLRYWELTQIMAFCRDLEVSDDPFYFVLDTWQKKELEMMAIQEKYDSLQKLKKLRIKWLDYEEQLFRDFVKETRKSGIIEQLADPFECLEYLKSANAISKEYLFSLSKWCADAVHNPPTRSQKRPLSHQLVELYKLMEDYDVDDKYIDKAILKFVISKGGLSLREPKPIPTVYKPGRKYIYTPDPENPRAEPEIKFLDEETIAAHQEDKNRHIGEIIDQLEPYPKFVEGVKGKKPSTQSGGKVSYRLKPKTKRQKNLPVNP